MDWQPRFQAKAASALRSAAAVHVGSGLPGNLARPGLTQQDTREQSPAGLFLPLAPINFKLFFIFTCHDSGEGGRTSAVLVNNFLEVELGIILHRKLVFL